jgi:hypothetical protein
VADAGEVHVAVADLQAHGLPPGVPPRRWRLTSQGADVPFRVLERAGAPGALVFRGETLSTTYSGLNVYVLTWSGAPPAMAVPLTRWDDPLPPGFVRVERNAIYVPNAPEDADPWTWDLLFGDGSPWPYAYDPAAGDFDLPSLREDAAGRVAVRLRVVGRSPHRHTIEARVNGVAVGSLVFEGAVPAVLEGELAPGVLRRFGNQLGLTYSAETSGPDDLGLVYLGGLDLGAPTGPPASPVAPRALSGFDSRLPALGNADYLIVSHGSFRAAAERVAALKEAEGRRAVVVDVARAYDRFSAGVVEAEALHALLRQAARGGRLRDVLLVGDDTFDYRDYLGTGAVGYVPSLHAWDGEFGRVPSENRFADLDGDGRPELAIGRLPVQTLDEAAALADKIARQRDVLRRSAARQLFAVDNQAPGDPSFSAMAASVPLPAGTQAVWADLGLGVDAARAALFDAWRRGAAVTHYFGHAGPEVWADEALLAEDDSAALADSGETLLLTWSCEAQWYQYLFGDTISEALLLLPRGGALAGFGPAGITDVALQPGLYQRLYRHLLAGLPLGEAIRRAKAEALAADPGLRPVVEGWNLLGDPALELELPRGEAGGGSARR